MPISQFLTDRAARVTVTVTRASGSGTNTSTYVFQENRMTINVREAGGKVGNARIRIEGVALAAMNNISRTWFTPMQIQAQDTVAIDVWDGNQFAPFFSGVMLWAATDAQTLPVVTLNIEATSLGGMAATTPPPYSVQGAVTLRNVITGILQGTGYTPVFANAVDLDKVITNPRLSGSAVDQLSQAMRAFPNLMWVCQLQQVYVFDRTIGQGDSPLLISPANGLQNSVSYSTSGVTGASLFVREMHPGRSLNVQSEFTLTGASQWLTNVVDHVLEPNKPGGRWTTSFAAQGLPNPNGTGTTTGS